MLVKPAALLLENKAQDLIGDEAWGEYAVALAWCFLGVMLTDLGLSNFTTQAYASKPTELRRTFAHHWGMKLLLVMLFPLVMLLLAWAKGESDTFMKLLLLVSVITAFNQLSEFLRFHIRAFQVFKIDSYLSVLEKCLYIVGVGALVYAGIDLQTFVWLRLGIWVLTFAIVYTLTVRIMGFRLPRIEWTKFLPTLRMSIPFSMLTILGAMNEKTDQIILKEMLDAQAVGIYAAAYRWMEAVFMFLWIVLPFFYARFAYLKDDPEAQQKLFEKGQLLTSLPLIFVSAFVFAYPEKLLFLFTHREAADLQQMADCMQILFAGCALYATFSIFDNLMTSTGYTKYVNRILLASIVANVVVNLLLIPYLGVLAAAYSTLMSYAIMSLSYLYVMKRYMHVRIPIRQLLKVGLWAATVFGGFILTKELGGLWYVALCGCAVGAVVMLGLLDLVPEDWKAKIKGYLGR